MRLIDKAKAHYGRLSDEPIKIEVPEWSEDGEKVIIYATPLTISERMKIQRHGKNDENEMAAEVVILKAKDKDGNPLFSKEDKVDLMRNVDSKIIGRIAQEIVGIDSDIQLVKEAEKN